MSVCCCCCIIAVYRNATHPSKRRIAAAAILTPGCIAQLMIYRRKIDGHKFVVLYPTTASRARCADVTPPPSTPPPSSLMLLPLPLPNAGNRVALCEGAHVLAGCHAAAAAAAAAPVVSPHREPLQSAWASRPAGSHHNKYTSVVFDSCARRRDASKQCDRNHLSAHMSAHTHTHTLMRHHKYQRSAFAYIYLRHRNRAGNERRRRIASRESPFTYKS